MATQNDITRADIVDLQREAVAARDGAQSDLCNLALAGDAASWRECERVILDARAQEDLCGRGDEDGPCQRKAGHAGRCCS